MRRYNYTQPPSSITTANQKLAEQEFLTILPENSFAKMAYEWKNSLRVAAEKMLGDQQTVFSKFDHLR
jgi:hypothetical protein